MLPVAQLPIGRLWVKSEESRLLKKVLPNSASLAKALNSLIKPHISETFIGDQGGNLFSLDLRTGRVVYAYKGNFSALLYDLISIYVVSLGFAGAVTSIAPSPSLMASTALDRFSRIHSTFAPPPEAGQQQEKKGEILDKIFMTNTPTVVVWDQDVTLPAPDTTGPEDDIWDNMVNVDDESDDELGGRKKRKGSQESRNR